MEQRWSARKPVPGAVRLSLPGGYARHAALRDLSLGGMGVVTAAPLVPGERVMLSFAVETDGHSNRLGLPAQVVHGDGQHAGLAFLDAGAETLHALRAVLGLHRAAAGAAVPHRQPEVRHSPILIL
jgi:hypothetical protein